MKKLFIPVIASLVLLASCDKIDNPIPDNSLVILNTEGILWDDSLYAESDPGLRKIVIEEFTGQLCTFCPTGAREIERLDSLYKDTLIPISIHAGSYALPSNGAPNDFTSVAGTTYNSQFSVTNWPAGTISRLNQASISGVSQWETDILTILGVTPKVKIGLSTLYDDSTRTVKAVVNTEWLSTEIGSFNLQLYMVEDSVVAYQLDGGTPVNNYVHRHMLRYAINGSWGTPIPTSNLGDIDNQEFAFELANDYDKNNCIIIAHVYKPGPDYEIIQAEELHIIE
jgi:hypothetical protein